MDLGESRPDSRTRLLSSRLDSPRDSLAIPTHRRISRAPALSNSISLSLVLTLSRTLFLSLVRSLSHPRHLSILVKYNNRMYITAVVRAHRTTTRQTTGCAHGASSRRRCRSRGPLVPSSSPLLSRLGTLRHTGRANDQREMSVYPRALARDIRTRVSERDRGYRHGRGRRARHRNSLGKPIARASVTARASANVS